MGRAESWAQLSRTFPMWEQGEKEEGDAAHSKKKKKKELMICRNGTKPDPPKSLNMVRFMRALLKCLSKLLSSNGFIG